MRYLQHDARYKYLLNSESNRACLRSRQLLSEGASAVDAVEQAISVLEDDECLNAGVCVCLNRCENTIETVFKGYGSNLTIDGTVECDAAIMDGRIGDFGSVGAVSGKAHPSTDESL